MMIWASQVGDFDGNLLNVAAGVLLQNLERLVLRYDRRREGHDDARRGRHGHGQVH